MEKHEWHFLNSDLTPIISALSAVALFMIGVRIVKIFLYESHVPIRDPSKTHNWRRSSQFIRDCYCNICEQLLISGDGLYCDCCGIYSDAMCTIKANQTIPCKFVHLPPDQVMKHQWVKGNLPFTSICDICDSDCETERLSGYKCCWCLRTVHSNCRRNIAEICDFGQYRSLIIPPTCIQVTKKGKRLVLENVSHPGWIEWTPLLVVANTKAGSKDGDVILSLFRSVLNPTQVVDLTNMKPEIALEWCCMLSNVPTIILVAGGDGTIGWILNSIHNLKFKINPAIGILPLGTGNDLSRVLGWGKEISPSSIQPTQVFDKLLAADRVLFDRWKVNIKPYRSLRIKRKIKEIFMYNYLSIGVDAQVTLDFHTARESRFNIFGSRLFNKMLYLGYGTQQIIEKKCQGLQSRLELYLDQVKVELPEIESIVILNIDSWGAGVNLWEMGKVEVDNGPEQSFNDGKLEVLAIYSSLHIAQLQVGLSLPHRVGQASSVRVKLKWPTAVQVDGEPWEQHPAEFEISHLNQTTVLKNLSSDI